MAKVIGPLFSQEARGQFGKSLVFTRRRGQNIVRGYVVPANPQTALQVTTRIAFAVAGIITRRTSAGRWTHEDNSQTMVQYWTSRATTGEVWNSAMVGAMLGISLANYNARVAEYAFLSESNQNGWEGEATDTIGGLSDYTRGEVTIKAGFMLFLAERTNSLAGYETLPANTAPVALRSGTA